MADDLQYNTPQDRLLIMLLERISALEDSQRILTQAVENLLKAPTETSRYIGICIETKKTTCSGPFRDTVKFIKNIIKEGFPQCTLYIERSVATYYSAQSIVLYLAFEMPISLKIIKEVLHIRLFRYIDIHNYINISESDMNILLQDRRLMEV